MNIFKDNNEKELKKLGKSVQKTSLDAMPSRRTKSQIKKRLMASIQEQSQMTQYAGLTGAIKKLASQISFPRDRKDTLRQRVVHYISLDLGSFSWTQVGGTGIFNRAAFATMMIFVMSFVSIFTFQLNTPITYAKDSVLHNVEGDVYVYRSGMLLTAHDGFVLSEHDKIHTGYDSSVTAVFMDDTVSRVSGESKLNINTLSSDIDVPGLTDITIGVAEGRMWSKVASTTGAFNVATLHTVVKVDRNATFDVRVAEAESVEISVVENFVDVELSSYSPAVNTTVVEGESLIVNGDESKIVTLDEQDQWLRMNLSKDEFETQLLAQQNSAELEDAVGALPGGTLYGVKTFKENLGVVLSINEREKLENQLMRAQKRLAEAELLVQKGLTGNAEDVLKEYKQIMLTLTQEYPDLIGITEVESQLDSMISRDKRRFHTTLPGSSLYDVKEVVEEVEILLANDRVRANQIALNQSSDDLYQVFNLLEHGGEALAEGAVEDYLITLDAAFKHLDEYSQDDRQGYVHAAFDTAFEDLKTLNALEDVVAEGSSLDVQATRDQLLEMLDVHLMLVEDEELYSEFAYELETLQAEDLAELVELSEFTGVSSTNAATVDVAIDAEDVIAEEVAE